MPSPSSKSSRLVNIKDNVAPFRAARRDIMVSQMSKQDSTNGFRFCGQVGLNLNFEEARLWGIRDSRKNVSPSYRVRRIHQSTGDHGEG
jgi:hypothetical protein